MGLFSNPLGYIGNPPNPQTAQFVNTTVRAATLAEVEAGLLDNVYVSPLTVSGTDAAIFASPPALGSTTPNAVHATTFDATTPVPVSSGGTGAATLTGLVVGSGTSALTTTAYTAATTFTPAFSLGTPGDSAWTYSARVGRYNRVGAVVYFTATLTWSGFSNSTGSGNWQLNLPVAAGAFVNAGQVVINGSGIDWNAQTAAIPANFVGNIATGASLVVLAGQLGGSTNSSSSVVNLAVAQVLTTGSLNISGFYFAA